MNKNSKLVIDKSKWGEGPWQHEPDRVEFEHLGIPCLMLRTSMGNWCGYAAVAPGHPWYRKSYDGEPGDLIEVHGGLTYADHCQGHICHVPKPGEPDNVWWFGFDCAHAGDLIPQFKEYGFADGVYRDADYVRSEVTQLANQLQKISVERS